MKTEFKEAPAIEFAPEIIQQILPSIRNNCLIADAQHSGLYSLCGLFLRLKDQFNWEQGRPPWSPTQEDRLLEWIDRRESQWLSGFDTPFEPIVIGERKFDSLNSQAINHHLLPLGYYYGAGYGRGLKPTFFLGAVREKYCHFGFTIIVLDRELALDLSLTPALHQGRHIIIRTEPLRFFLWAKIQETEQFEREATAMALNFYGWDPKRSPEEQMGPILKAEAETILHHELGEALDRAFPRVLWKKLLMTFPFSRVELYLRTLKDLLADTHPRGTLAHIIRMRKAGSVAFYLSNLKGLRRSLFPEFPQAVRRFKEEEDFSSLEQVAREGRQRMLVQTRRIKELAGQTLPDRPEAFCQSFEREFFKPLGL